MYSMAIYVWSAVALLAVALPFAVVLARETGAALRCCLRSDPPAARGSSPSFSHHSAPSHPGY